MSMQKNVAGQKVGVQMITAADGTEFTGSVTVEVTIDAGTQGTGSVGSGACTHEGHGYHTYAPAQAETNGDLVAFTFHGTGAISATVHERPNTVAVDLATIASYIDTEVAAIKAKTDNLPSDPADASDIAAEFATVNTKLDAIDDYVDTEVAAIKAKTDNLPSDPADASDIATAFAAVPAAVWALILEAAGSPDYTAADLMRLIAAAILGKSSGLDLGLPVFRDVNDTKDRITAVTDADGNRTAVVVDPS